MCLSKLHLEHILLVAIKKHDTLHCLLLFDTAMSKSERELWIFASICADSMVMLSYPRMNDVKAE